MTTFLKIIKSRNFTLIVSLILALSFGGLAPFLKNYTLIILATIMTFSVSGLSFSIIKNYKLLAKTTLHSILLNYIIFGTLMLVLAYLFFGFSDIFLGFVVIVASPPGVAIIPFTYNFKGDLNYSFRGILGTYLASILITPLIIYAFSSESSINPLKIVLVIGEVIVIPLIISRFLMSEKVLPFVEKFRGKVIDYGFGLIIYTAVALNKDAIFSDYNLLLKSSIVIFTGVFILGWIYHFFTKKRITKEMAVSQNLMLTMKSSGFAIATSLALFGEQASIPASILSVFVLIFLIYKGFVHKS